MSIVYLMWGNAPPIRIEIAKKWMGCTRSHSHIYGYGYGYGTRSLMASEWMPSFDEREREPPPPLHVKKEAQLNSHWNRLGVANKPGGGG